MMDERCPLDDVLDLLRVRGALMAHVRGNAPWGLRLPRASGATFHAVIAGACWVRIPGQRPRELLAGDVILLPTGAAHVLSSDPTGTAQAWDRAAKARALNARGELVLGGPGRSTHIACAAYTYDREVAHPLLSLLPAALFISGQETPEGSAAQATLRLLRHELAVRSSGRDTVIDRLIDVLFVHVIRAWIAGQHDNDMSWLSALRDPTIGRALSVLHARPEASWSLDALAREVNVSRATLMRRFTALVGEPPLSYLARWRMDLAARELRETTDAVSAIAHRVGYGSEFAFSRAFSRIRGRSPGRYRAEARRRAREAE
jgi:AraC-like DNA-binding protein